MTIDNSESGEQKLDELLSTSLLEYLPDACVIFDQRFYIIKMNSKAEQFFLFPKEYMMSKPFWEISPQYINTNIFHAMNKIKKERKELNLEFVGSITNRWFGANLQMIGDYILVFFKDITRHKHTQNELIGAEKRFSAVFKNSPALMAIISLENNKLISVNDKYANLFGYTPQEIIGMTRDEVFVAIDNPADQMLLQKQPMNNKLSKLISVRTKSNGYKNIVFSSELIIINEVPCRLEIGIDITENLKYQKELQRLEHLNLLGQMSASIAHEIRNPLQTIKGFLQLLQIKEEILPYQNYFTLMADELTRVNGIISEFLSLSRTKETNLKLHNINDIINSVLPLMEAQALEEDKRIEVELKIVPQTMLDEDEIKQVLLNLVKNGLEASKVNGRVKIITDCDETSVALTICDYGHGIPQELQANIGMPFFTTKLCGTGLGLSVSLSILERHNAKMSFTSNQNGTTFRINFPLH